LPDPRIETDKLSVYPNPVTDVLRVTIRGPGIEPDPTFMLTDIAGRAVRDLSTVPHAQSAASAWTSDVTDLASGAYCLIVAHGPLTASRMFIKE
ncbi:MAG: T9SS type A sorting domain-containing protein, partial [Flavobacteriales bacterium]|nr:T9SS type A sorting domain-containing protein [Flavobacteriales bacterium]